MGVNDPAPKPNLQELFAPVDKTTNRITNRTHVFYSNASTAEIILYGLKLGAWVKNAER